MPISPIEKILLLTEDAALLTKIFMGKKANLVKFIWFVKYFFNVFAANFNLRKNFFQTDMPPSFYYSGFMNVGQTFDFAFNAFYTVRVRMGCNV